MCDEKTHKKDCVWKYIWIDHPIIMVAIHKLLCHLFNNDYNGD